MIYPEADLTKKWWYNIKSTIKEKDGYRIYDYFCENALEEEIKKWTKKMDICYTPIGF